jgi:hypothetical protein
MQIIFGKRPFTVCSGFQMVTVHGKNLFIPKCFENFPRFENTTYVDE